MRSCRLQKVTVATLVLSAGLVVPAGVIAQSQKADSESLQTITVLSNEQIQTGSVVNDEESISTSRIHREELTRAQTSLAEIVARETGVQYQQSGGFGSYSSISIRAASAAQTGVYLNGVLLNSGANPVVDLSTLEILNLDAVDLYRGSTPLQLGHASIGGAINLRTPSTVANPETRVRLGLGSYSDAGVQLSRQSTKGAWHFVTAASYRESENDFSFNNDNGTPLNTGDDERQSRNNAAAERKALLLQAGYRHNATSRTDLTLQSAARRLGVPQWRNRPDNSASYDTLSTQIQLSHIHDQVSNWNTKHSVYWHLDDSHYQDLLAQIGLGADDRRFDTRTVGAKSYWEYPTDSGYAGVSLNLRQEKLDSKDQLDASANYSVDRNEWLGTLHYTWFDASDKWTITPAIRTQFNDLQAFAQRDNNQPEAQDSSHTGAQLGIRYQPSRQLHFSMNVGSFFRSPSFGELYGSIGLINGNPALIPEEGINADMGVHYTTRKLTLASTLFVSRKDELIVTSFDSRGVGRPVNAGEASVTGIEFIAQWAINEHWNVRSNMTCQLPKSIDKRAGFHDKFLPGQSQFAWYARAQYTPSRWSVWYEADIERKRFYDRANILPAPDTTQHSIGVGWRGSQWHANLSVQNLSDTTVEDFNGFPKPGRRWALSITHTL